MVLLNVCVQVMVTMAVFDIEFRATSVVFLARSATATLKRRWQNLELFCIFNGEHLEVRISHAGSLTGEHLHVMPSGDSQSVVEMRLPTGRKPSITSPGGNAQVTMVTWRQGASGRSTSSLGGKHKCALCHHSFVHQNPRARRL